MKLKYKFLIGAIVAEIFGLCFIIAEATVLAISCAVIGMILAILYIIDDTGIA